MWWRSQKKGFKCVSEADIKLRGFEFMASVDMDYYEVPNLSLLVKDSSYVFCFRVESHQ